MVDFIKEEPDPEGDGTNPTLATVIEEALRAAKDELRVGGPATVVSYDFKLKLAAVRPDHKRRYDDGTVEDAPIIYNVPVKHPQAGGAFIHLPIKPGHKVWLSYGDKSLEKWLSNGEPNDPDDTRSHHISDAVAYPGCYPFNDTVKIANGDDIIIKNEGGAEIRVKPNGHIQIRSKTQELIKVLMDWLQDDIDGDHSDLYRIKTRLKTFLEK